MKIFLAIAISFAGVLAKAEAIQTNTCNAKTYSEIVQCLVNNSADLKISEQKLVATSKLQDAASQWINPEIEAESLRKDSQKSETTAAILFNIRLGSKGSAAAQEASAEIKKATFEHQANKDFKRLEIISSLYKLSHLQKEILIEAETGETFTKIVNQFQSRSALSPDQLVSLDIFKMALSDHQLKIISMKSDFEQQLQDLAISANIPKELILKNLPTRKDVWPEVTTSSSSEKNHPVQIARAEVALAQAQFAKANSEAWPDIKAGPIIKNSKENGEANNFIGLTLSMPLPVFSLNSGQRSYYEQKKISADMNAQYVEKATALKKELLKQKYTQLVFNLKKSLNSKELNEKHEKIERQFFKGLVTSSLVIEAHRQLFDLESRKNTAELDAINTLGELLILDNQFEGVIL